MKTTESKIDKIYRLKHELYAERARADRLAEALRESQTVLAHIKGSNGCYMKDAEYILGITGNLERNSQALSEHAQARRKA